MLLPHESYLLTAMLLACGLALAVAGLGWRLRQAGAAREGLRQENRRLLDAGFDGVLIHRGGVVLQMNSALQTMLGCREADWLGRNFSHFALPGQTGLLHAALAAPLPPVAAFELLRADQTRLPVEIRSQAIAFDLLPATLTAIRDVSQRRADAARISQLLDYDALTGLANRKSFYETMVQRLAAQDKTAGGAALFSIDLYQFKTVNEQIGRAAGDRLLQLVAARIARLTTEHDVLGRIGGDKFGLLVTGPAPPGAGPARAGPARAGPLAAQLEAALNEPFMIDGQPVKASLSIGIALYPDHAADADALLRASDFVLKRISAAGGGFSLLFSHEIEGAQPQPGRDGFRLGLTESQRLLQDLRGALARQEISLVYQPIFRGEDLALAGYEALARWHHHRDGSISPATFIPLAEQAGLIHEIGRFVLETACAEAAARPGHLKMAVNLSPLQFRDPHLPARISAILRKTGLAPARLELEVTESVLIENSAAATQALAALRAIGVNVALDDFGTGYSSLSYLCDYPFARLKIDKRFIQAVGTDKNADAIVVAILSLARDLDLDVTAEGVETEAQLAFLQELNCSQLQGFLLGKPAARGMLAAAVSAPAPAPALAAVEPAEQVAAPPGAFIPPPGRERTIALPATLIPSRAL